MTQEQKQLLLQDLCARLPYGVIIYSKEYEEANYRKHYLQRLFNISAGRRMEVTCVDVDDYPDPKCREHKLELCRPYLRPMSSMTEEESKEYTEKIKGVFYGSLLDNALLIDWLNEKMFDYRGLIEKGLAIEVTEENNPYKN